MTPIPHSDNLNPVTDLVLVVGATGGVGQLTVSELLTQNIKVRVLVRNAAKAQEMFADQVEIIVGDTRQADTIPAAMPGVTHIISCTGSTAFPTSRWQFRQTSSKWEWCKRYANPNYCRAQAENSPEKVDAIGGQNLVNAAPKDLKRFLLVSACGVERKDKLPFSLLNSFGVLDAKLVGETVLRNSGLPYTIVRPGRLIDGPYTSYDLNTLLKAKTESQLGIVLGRGDILSGETSRIDLAAACVACLHNPKMVGKVFEIMSAGSRPSPIDWDGLLVQLA